MDPGRFCGVKRFFLHRTRSILQFGSNSKVAVVSFLAGNSEAGNEKVDKDDSLLYCCRSDPHISTTITCSTNTPFDRSLAFFIVMTPDVTEKQTSQAY
jgi:hypothetical protein